jgi:hypothetical protein
MMMTRFSAMAAMLAAEVLLLATSGQACAQLAGVPDQDARRPSGFLTTLNPGWQRYFKIDWAPATHHGKAGIEGHIRNDGILPAARIRLLVDALDASGNVVDQHLVWLLSPDLTPGTRGYFEASFPGPAVSYRVSVYSFDWQRRG